MGEPHIMNNDASASSPPDLIITVVPEPTADERDAVVAALTVLRFIQSVPEKPQSRPSRWSMAGRVAAHRSGVISHVRKPTGT